MTSWAEDAPVVIRRSLTPAEQLWRAGYYAHAGFEGRPEDATIMTFGQSKGTFVFELLRWRGPGAELIRPQPWRKIFANEIRALLGIYKISWPLQILKN